MTESVDGTLIAATWDFGKACNDAALEALQQGGTALDAVEQGAWVAEADSGNNSVGRGGIPNQQGEVEVDAAIMWGPGSQAGSVAALKNTLHPISVARRVMENSKHVMLVGEGAQLFAREQGFALEELLTTESRKGWEEWRKEQGEKSANNHDTIGIVALDRDGNLAASCSTSGAGYKHAGRVGDSPIIGSGLYVDNEVGAVAATGLGEDIMRYCASFAVVSHMERGLSPEDACLELLGHIAAKDPKGADVSIGLVAVDKQGRFAGAGMRREFPYAVCRAGDNRVLQGRWVAE